MPLPLTPPDPRAILPTVEQRELSLLGSTSLGPDDIPFVSALENHFRARSQAMWRSGVEPLPFDAFVEHVTAVEGEKPAQLTARQRYVFESCNLMRASELFGPNRHVQELTLVFGKGSGKGFVLSLFFAWASLVLCEMRPDPSAYFGTSARSGMVGINVAPTADLARNVFYRYLKRWMMSDLLRPYWQPFLKQGTEPNADQVELYRPDKPTSRHPSKGDAYPFMQILSRHSNGAGLDGHNIILWAADELAAFVKTPERDTGREIHGILRSSASTRHGRFWIGLGMSYPREENDLILQLREEALADMAEFGPKSTRFTDLAATWEVRPSVKRTDPSIAADYKNDPRGAIAKYECQPRSAMDAFIENPEELDASIRADLQPAVLYRTQLKESHTDRSRRVSVQLLEVNREPGASYFLFADGGVSKDSYTVSIWARRSGSSAASLGSADWLCPECARKEVEQLYTRAWNIVPVRDPATGGYSMFKTRRIEHRPECLTCDDIPPHRPMLADDGSGPIDAFQISDWRTTGMAPGMPDGRPATGTLTVNMGDGTTRTVEVPRLFQAGLLVWKPRAARRAGEENNPVDFSNVEEVIHELILKLGIRSAGCDPWQNIGMIQRLNGVGGCKFEAVNFGNPEQMKRGRLAKSMLYANSLELLPYAEHDPELDGNSPNWVGGKPNWGGSDTRRTEWRRLRQAGMKLDHPADGSKDIVDSDFGAIYLAMEAEHGKLTALWME